MQIPRSHAGLCRYNASIWPNWRRGERKRLHGEITSAWRKRVCLRAVTGHLAWRQAGRSRRLPQCVDRPACPLPGGRQVASSQHGGRGAAQERQNGRQSATDSQRDWSAERPVGMELTGQSERLLSTAVYLTHWLVRNIKSFFSTLPYFYPTSCNAIVTPGLVDVVQRPCSRLRAASLQCWPSLAGTSH